MSFFSGRFFQPTFYEADELNFEEFKTVDIVADVLTPWDISRDMNYPEIVSEYPEVRWDNKDECPSRNLYLWKTMYLSRVICDQYTLRKIRDDGKYYIITAGDNQKLDEDTMASLRAYLVDNGFCHAEAVYYMGKIHNPMKCVSNNIKDFLNKKV